MWLPLDADSPAGAIAVRPLAQPLARINVTVTDQHVPQGY